MDSEQSFEIQQKQVLDYLQEGKLYLEQDAPQDALSVLQKAFELVPSNVAVRTLLALSHFKLGNLADAEAIYKALIDENPREASLRSHLAMQYIQQKRYNDGCVLLEEAEEIQPDNMTIHNSLAIVYAKLGDYAKAKDKFLLVGQDEMAEKMEQKLREKLALSVDLEFDLPEEEEEEPAPVSMQESSSDDGQPISVVVLPIADDGSRVKIQDEGDVPFSLDPQDPAHSGELDALTPFIPKESPSSSIPSIPVASLAPQVDNPKLWLPFDTELEQKVGAFSLLEKGHLLIHTENRVYARLASLSYLSGSPEITLENKRFQGKAVDQLFGPLENPVARLDGDCQLLLRASEKTFRTVLEISLKQSAYFCEGVVLAFEDTLSWENGRIPSPNTEIADLPLDNLWGNGRIVIEGQSRFWGVPVRAGKRVRVDYRYLVGWLGSLVPRIVVDKEIPSSDGIPKAFVEFEGEGGVLLSS